MTRLVFGILVALLIMSGRLASQASNQDALAAARDLYASAAYEDALAVLNSLPETPRPAEDMRAIEQYRALCLLALGRAGEAERAIETVVAGDPMYHPAPEVSPRLRSAFSDVRKRVLPVIIQQQYTRAKAEYDRKEFAAAAADFSQLIKVMTDPDAAGNQVISDLRTIATGFKDLAASAAAPPPPPPAPAPVEVPQAPKPPKVYSSADAGVVHPIPLRQDLPPYPGSVTVMRHGLIEVVVDETGIVESASMRVPVGTVYDSMALAAARAWRYRPATVNGLPVKFRKVVQVTVKPATSVSR